MMKKCRGCNETKDEGLFSRNQWSRPDERRRCKQCIEIECGDYSRSKRQRPSPPKRVPKRPPSPDYQFPDFCFPSNLNSMNFEAMWYNKLMWRELYGDRAAEVSQHQPLSDAKEENQQHMYSETEEEESRRPYFNSKDTGIQQTLDSYFNLYGYRRPRKKLRMSNVRANQPKHAVAKLVCSLCKCEKHEEEFYALASICIECNRVWQPLEYERGYRRDRYYREKLREFKRDYPNHSWDLEIIEKLYEEEFKKHYAEGCVRVPLEPQDKDGYSQSMINSYVLDPGQYIFGHDEKEEYWTNHCEYLLFDEDEEDNVREPLEPVDEEDYFQYMINKYTCNSDRPAPQQQQPEEGSDYDSEDERFEIENHYEEDYIHMPLDPIDEDGYFQCAINEYVCNPDHYAQQQTDLKKRSKLWFLLFAFLLLVIFGAIKIKGNGSAWASVTVTLAGAITISFRIKR
jgi:hypothetical protein